MKLFSKIAAIFRKPKKRRQRRGSVTNKIIASFDAGNTTKEGLYAEFPSDSPQYIYQVLRKGGRKWTRTTFGGLNTRDRDAEIINLRRSGMTLTEIGAKYEITRERVRQIIVRLAPDLTDDVVRDARLGPLPKCPECGKELRRGGRNKTCGSHECRSIRWSNLTPMQRERGERILTLRAFGMTWEEIANRVWPEKPKDTAYAAYAQTYAKTYAKKTGEDISWAFCGLKGVHTPRLAQRIVEACQQSGSRFAVHKDAAE